MALAVCFWHESQSETVVIAVNSQSCLVSLDASLRSFHCQMSNKP